MVTINFDDYVVSVDYDDFKTTIKQILSDMDKKTLIELIWDELSNYELIDIFKDRLMDAYPQPDDTDTDAEISKYYDSVRM